MMDRAVNEFERARGRMAGDFRTMITDSEDLLKAAATVSGEGFTAARAKFEEKLREVDSIGYWVPDWVPGMEQMFEEGMLLSLWMGEAMVSGTVKPEMAQLMVELKVHVFEFSSFF